jgi:DsbC/DsbD-like thiol-disulfide interchange protein
MKKHLLQTAAAVLVLGIAFVCATSAQSVSGSLGTVHKGTAARGTVYLSLPGGTHANSNRPGNEYQIPTVVRVTPPRGVIVGRVSYPAGRNRKFAFSETPINVYEGRVPFTFTVKVPAGYKGETVRITASVRYQACTDEVCYAPKTKTVTLTANVQ